MESKQYRRRIASHILVTWYVSGSEFEARNFVLVQPDNFLKGGYLPVVGTSFFHNVLLSLHQD